MDELESLYVVFAVVGVIGLIYYTVLIFFLLTQQNLLKALKPENRAMEPGLVWLQLVPLFSLGWRFYVVSKITESLKREFYSWGNEESLLGYTDPDAVMYSQEQPAYGIGIAFSVLYCCMIIPYLGCLAMVGAIVFGIIYWVKLSEYKAKVSRHNLGLI